MPSFTIEKLRRAKKTIYLVACLYIVIGLLVAIVAALSGDRLSAFLGFLIITGALACGAVLVVLLRFGVHLSDIGEQLQQLHNTLAHVQRTQQQFNSAIAKNETQEKPLMIPHKQERPFDDTLVAATLDRSRFPRLAKMMTTEQSGKSSLNKTSSTITSTTHNQKNDTTAKESTSRLAYTKLPRTWQIAHREGDIVACRAILSTYVDTASTAAVEVMTIQLEQLIDQSAAHLRQSFAGHIHRADYAGALAVGQRIVELMPEHDLSEEFKHIKPYLSQRINQQEQATTSV